MVVVFITMQIREIKTKDIDSFLDFFRKSVKTQFDEYSKNSKDFFLKKEWTKQRIKNSIKGDYIIYLLAFEKDKIVGYLIGSHSYGGVATVMWLAVDDDCQGRGIGRRLMNTFIDFLKEEGAHKVKLDVTNKENLGFYKKLGFTVQCLSKKDYFGLDSHWMYKDIQKPRW
jgi:ribosomal protein S18 acetylase RimI-like enzyme